MPAGCQQRGPTIGQPAPARRPVLVDLQNLQTKSPQNTPPLLHNLTTLTVSTIIPDYLPYAASCPLRGQVLWRNIFDVKYPASIASSSASQMSTPVCISTSPPNHTTTASSYATITLDSHSVNRAHPCFKSICSLRLVFIRVSARRRQTFTLTSWRSNRVPVQIDCSDGLSTLRC